MAVGDVAVLRVVGNFQEQNIVNTMHYQVDDQVGGDSALWQELVTQWISEHESNWLARHHVSYELVGVKAFTAKGQSHPPGESSLGNLGTVIGDPVFAFVCRTITLYGDSGNPRRRGRIMLSGGEDTMFTASRGAVSAGEVIELTALGEDLIGTLSGGTNAYTPVLYQKLPETITNLTIAKGRVTPASVRSRRIRKFLIG